MQVYRPRRLCRFIASLTVLFLSLGGVASAAPGEQEDPVPLFSASAAADDTLGTPGEIPGEAIYVRVDRSALSFANIRFTLPDGSPVIATRDKRIVGGPDEIVWIGHVPDVAGSRVLLAMRGEAVSGSIMLGERHFKLIYQPGFHRLGEFEPAAPLPVGEPLLLDLPTGDLPPLSGNDDGSVIDVLVVYTPKARDANGGTAGIESLIDLAVAETNTAYTNSQMQPQLRLVHAAKVDYEESGNLNLDLVRLQDADDNFMDEVHALRDQYGADVVSLISTSENLCGIAYLMTEESPAFEIAAFSAVYWGCATGYYSFGHEIGHNQGAHHDRSSTSMPGVFPYSFGYQDPKAEFRTVMAYDCPGGCVRIQHFSNPDVTFDDSPTGIDHDLDAPNSADNARTIDETRVTVGNFRQSVSSGQPPAAPSALIAQVVSATRIDLLWSDGSGDEQGFRVERSTNGGAWSEIAVLPANTEAFVDTDLSPETAYAYRVRAYNGAGNSAYSISAATTYPLPATPTGLRIDQTGIDYVELSWDVSGAPGVIGYRLYRDGAWFASTTATSYTDDPLAPATTYGYQVSAYDASANESALSPIVAATTEAVGSDTVTILEATYKADRDELKVRATSTAQPDVVLSVEGYGEMEWNKEKYELKLRPFGQTVPQTVTVLSSLGGTATAPVTGAPPPPLPGEASGPQPADGAVFVPVDAILDWVAGSNADSHDVYFGNSDAPAFQGNQQETGFDPGPLTMGVTYHWRVDEVNEYGVTRGRLWSFTTEPEPAPPGPVDSPNPADGAFGVSVEALLQWSAGLGAESHDVYFGTSPNPPYQGNQTGTSYDPGPLDHETTYFWRIDAVNPLGTTTGFVWSFTTSAARPPDTVTILEAVYKADRDELKVRATSSNQPDAVLIVEGYGAMEWKKDKYELKLRPFGQTVPQTVRVLSSFGGSAELPVDGAPPLPLPGEASNPNPADGAVYVPAGTSLSWTAGANTDTHDVYFGTSKIPPFRGSETGTDYDPGTLAQGVTYYWRIDEVNELGTTEGPLWRFTTEPEPGPPMPAAAPSPADGAINVEPDTLLSWTPGAGTKTHKVYFGTTANPPLQSTQVDPLFDPGPLAYETTYYWRIDGENELGVTTGPLWSFTTSSELPADVVEITKAEWKIKDGELKVRATSTVFPEAILTVVGFGTMAVKKGDYEYKEKGHENPLTVTVTSGYGGVATSEVRVR